MKSKKIFVHVSQVSFMQRIAEHARQGFSQYVSGDCPADRLRALHEKFRRLYDIEQGKDERYRARRAGLPVFVFFLYQQNANTEGPVSWVLMRTEAERPHPLGELEKWRRVDAADQRLRVFGKFELVRHTREGSARPAWSWRMPKARHEAIRGDVVSMVRRRENRALDALLADLRTAPGFAPVRKQLAGIYGLLRAEWKRSRADSEPLPQLPDRIGYTRFKQSKLRALA